MTIVAQALRALSAGATLPSADAEQVMDAVMRGEVADAQFGALFALLHARGETVEELVGFACSMRRHVVPVECPDGAIDTCGTGGDGADTFNVSTAAAMVVAGAGVTVAKHGNRAVSSRCGSADVLEALGGRLETTPAQAQAALEQVGFAFLFAPAFHPSMRHAGPPRRALGMRTAFNFLGPITNPAGVRRQVVGVSDLEAAARIADVLRELGCVRALVVHGRDGLDELTLGAATVAFDVSPDGVRRMEVRPEDAGLARAPVAALAGGEAARNAGILRDVLGGARGPARDVVLLNAAAGLIVAERAGDLREGVELAARSIDDGDAADRLQRWIEFGLEVPA